MASEMMLVEKIGGLGKDIGEIAAWIEKVQEILGDFDQAEAVPEEVPWDPPPTATPAPIATPKCLRPESVMTPTTSIGDLVQTLGALHDWLKDLQEMINGPSL